MAVAKNQIEELVVVMTKYLSLEEAFHLCEDLAVTEAARRNGSFLLIIQRMGEWIWQTQKARKHEQKRKE